MIAVINSFVRAIVYPRPTTSLPIESVRLASLLSKLLIASAIAPARKKVSLLPSPPHHRQNRFIELVSKVRLLKNWFYRRRRPARGNPLCHHEKAHRHENTMELYFRALLKNGESFEVRLYRL